MHFGWLVLLGVSGLEWLVNPNLFLAGAGLVSVPIIIHLLNKRKFRTVDWAAMDFLLDADKKNRRRIRLENLLLLLLRCLAVFLIGLLLARPFIPTAMTAGLLESTQYERIVLLDDSLSMQARVGNESVWDLARRRLADLTLALASERGDNAFTLLLTSDPEQRQFNSQNLRPDTVDEINSAIAKLEPGDGVARLEVALDELEKHLTSQPANVNRVVYIFTDLRRRDWRTGEGENQPVKLLERLSELTVGTFVVDLGEGDDRNLSLIEVRPEGTLVEGVTSRFDVSVANRGSSEARDVRVRLLAGDALPVVQEVERIPAGETIAVPFSFTFTDEEGEASDSTRPLPPRKVRIEVATVQAGVDDRLEADSVAFFPARLVRGIPVLVVDGDPSADYGRSESFYLKRALSPRGPIPSGVAVQVVTETELESLNLDAFQVVFLCNVYRLGDKTNDAIARLEKWTAAGGGLVLMPGDQVDEQFFNEHYFRDGEGLSPLRLDSIRGDETELQWVNFRVEQATHPALRVFEGQNNPFLDNVKVFRWWNAFAKKEQVGAEVAVTARLSDADDAPAMAEKAFGKGRVVTTAIPADADWTNWSSDPSYIIAMQELVRYLSGDKGDRGQLRVGEPIKQPVDLTRYEIDAALLGPKERKASVQAFAPPGGGTQGPEATVWNIEYPDTRQRGFYELKLAGRDGLTADVLFAANVDPTEGDLRRVDVTTLQRELADTNVQILTGNASLALGNLGDRAEVWWYLLWGVAAVLGLEQLLAWWFGWGR